MKVKKIISIVLVAFLMTNLLSIKSFSYYPPLDEVIYASQVLSGQNVDLTGGHTAVVVINDVDEIIWVNIEKANDGTRRNISITYEKDTENYRYNNMKLNPNAECTPISGIICVTLNEVTYVAPTEEVKNESGNHTHNFVYSVIINPTIISDGLEGEVCSCGETRNIQKVSAYGYALNDYATPMINSSWAGQTVTFELGEWNSFPKAFMEKIAAKSLEGVTFIFHYKWNHVKQEIIIPYGTIVDTGFDWYGPAKMAELYGTN